MPLTIHLRDLAPDIVAAWKREFIGCPDVDASCGDIFGVKADAIVSPANSFGFMDGGIDMVYSRRFGWDLQKRLQAKIAAECYGELPVGCALIVSTGDAGYPYLVSCPTMRLPEDVSMTLNAYLAFRAGLIEIERFNMANRDGGAEIKSVLCPGLGTMIGCLPAGNCAKQMRAAYNVIIGRQRTIPLRLGDIENI